MKASFALQAPACDRAADTRFLVFLSCSHTVADHFQEQVGHLRSVTYTPDAADLTFLIPCVSQALRLENERLKADLDPNSVTVSSYTLILTHTHTFRTSSHPNTEVLQNCGMPSGTEKFEALTTSHLCCIIL